MKMQYTCDTKRALENITRMLVAITEEHADWPDSAVFKVEYRTGCWPTGINILDTPHVRYFNTQAELDTWKEEYRRWAGLEDNQITYTVYEWDLGPTYLYSDWH